MGQENETYEWTPQEVQAEAARRVRDAGGDPNARPGLVDQEIEEFYRYGRFRERVESPESHEGTPEHQAFSDDPTPEQTATLRNQESELWAREAAALRYERGIDPEARPDLVDLRVRVALRREGMMAETVQGSWAVGASDRSPAELARDLPAAIAAGPHDIAAWEHLMAPRRLAVAFDENAGLADRLHELADSAERSGYMLKASYARVKVGAHGCVLGSTLVEAVAKHATNLPKNGETCGNNLVALAKMLRALARAVEREKNPHQAASAENETLLARIREFNSLNSSASSEPPSLRVGSTAQVVPRG